jgi:cell division protein FtsI (penicillin-binding protein 3)
MKVGYGRITVERAFELSSEHGHQSRRHKAYGNDPKRFVEGLKRMGLHQPTACAHSRRTMPTLRGPGEKGWSGVSLPWMSIGYEVTLFTPLQTLTFYNAVANNGRMMQPQFVDRMFHGREARLSEFEPVVLNERICIEGHPGDARRMLEGVVDTGTAMNLKGAHFKIAGKTGTAQIASGRRATSRTGVSYQASFAGYFPADAPKLQLHRGGERTHHERLLRQRGGRPHLQGDRRQDLQQPPGDADGAGRHWPSQNAAGRAHR